MPSKEIYVLEQMSTSDMTEYLRVKMAERGNLADAKFMEDGFDRWAESEAPARSGQMEKIPAESKMEGFGGALTLSKAKRLQMMGGSMCGGQMRGGFDPVAEFNNIKNAAKDLLDMWRGISKWINEVKGELKDEIIDNENAPASYKEVARVFMQVLDSLAAVQGVLDGVASAASAVGLGKRGMRGGSVTDDIKKYGKMIFDVYKWVKANGPGIRAVLSLKSMQPVGGEVLKVLNPIFGFIGAGRRIGGVKCECSGGRKSALPVLDISAMGMGRRRGGADKQPKYSWDEPELPSIREMEAKSGYSMSPSAADKANADRLYAEYQKKQASVGSTMRKQKKEPQTFGGRKPSARGEIVKQVMREQGLSLPQASSYVKQHGLY